ncbi:MAG: hypothetical protein V4692_09465 [Bdellovibrionota bacterium]
MSLGSQGTSNLFVSPRDYFDQIVTEAIERRRIKTYPLVKGYIVELLEFYVPAQNLFDETDSSGRLTRETLAETFLRAQSAEDSVRTELLKKLGDRSLYISGFFGDSLQRKLVDIDYYADMGGMAYGALASAAREDTAAKVFDEFARRFLEFVDLLTDISSRAKLQNEENILRLFEVYAKTGSEVARERLIEKGVITMPSDQVRYKKQQ